MQSKGVLSRVLSHIALLEHEIATTQNKLERLQLWLDLKVELDERTESVGEEEQCAT